MMLLLAGTGEARKIADALARENIDAVASLSGATREPQKLAIATRNGGFGGDDGFRKYLRDHGVTAILDATHPFAAQISQRSSRIAQECALPYLQILRPAWRAEPGDNWIEIDSEHEARAHVAKGATVFLATGRQTLDRFANLADCTLICRQIDPFEREFPFENGRFLLGRPPFSKSDEIALFKKLNVDVLVVKNAGGVASRTKLDAAIVLGIPVIMLRRPARRGANSVETVAQALVWVRGLS